MKDSQLKSDPKNRGGAYWWLLNNDARPEPGALGALLRALGAEGADFAGSRVVAFDDPSREISAGGWIDARTGASATAAFSAAAGLTTRIFPGVKR